MRCLKRKIGCSIVPHNLSGNPIRGPYGAVLASKYQDVIKNSLADGIKPPPPRWDEERKEFVEDRGKRGKAAAKGSESKASDEMDVDEEEGEKDDGKAGSADVDAKDDAEVDSQLRVASATSDAAASRPIAPLPKTSLSSMKAWVGKPPPAVAKGKGKERADRPLQEAEASSSSDRSARLGLRPGEVKCKSASLFLDGAIN